MKTGLIIVLCIFTVLALVCALWFSVLRDAGIGRRRDRTDPFFHPFGDVPRLSDQQLRETAERITRDPLRRSFVTRDLNSGQRRPPRVGPDADGVGVLNPHSPRLHAVRSFFALLLGSRRHAA